MRTRDIAGPGEVLYSVIDRDTGERYSSYLFESREGAERERAVLSRVALPAEKPRLGIGRVCSFLLDEDVTDE